MFNHSSAKPGKQKWKTPLRSPRFIACQDRIMPLLCSVQSWYKILYEETHKLIFGGQQKSSCSQGGQLFEAGTAMPLKQQLALAVQPQSPFTELFSSGNGLVFYLFSPVLLHFIPK